VLIRPNPLQFGHLGLEIMFGVRLANRFRAPLYIIRPDKVVNTALYELVAHDVTINVVEGWRGGLLTWAFFSGSALHVKDKAIPYASPIGYLLTYRFFRFNKFIASGLGNKLNRAKKYARMALKYSRALAHIAKRILVTGRGTSIILDPDYVSEEKKVGDAGSSVARMSDIRIEPASFAVEDDFG
jgi:hypothetical protein